MKIKILAAAAAAFLLFGCTADSPQIQSPSIQENMSDAETVPELTEPEKEIITAETTAEKILKDMTIEEKIGQMFFARCPDINAVEDVKNLYLGGYILFARDFENKTAQEVISDIESYQAAAEIPLLIGVDEEGGTVVRASKYKALRDEPFKSMLEVSKGGVDALIADTTEKTSFLKSLGINVNLAPVCDVPESENDYIYPRCFSLDAETAAEYTAAVAGEMKRGGIGCVLKHFPGYGGNADTHTGIAVDTRTLDELRSRDFLPFVSGIGAGADSVLVSHNIIEEADGLPASVSPEIHSILRDELGFNGVVMTDDLAMEGIRAFAPPDEDIAVMAVLAGNDMIISSSPAEQSAEVIEAFKAGEINEERINDAVRRILVWKINLGLIPMENTAEG